MSVVEPSPTPKTQDLGWMVSSGTEGSPPDLPAEALAPMPLAR
jgi:hypothetical protein